LPAIPSRSGVLNFDKQKKVRKKLRSTVQLLAHLAGGLDLERLEGNSRVKLAKQLRNFLRSGGV
jgi:hypothetical protein